MKNLRIKYWYYILIILALFYAMTSFGQLPYSWTPSVDPGWTSSNNTPNTLSWQPNAGIVSTSDLISGTNWNTYDDDQITTYTSPVYDFTCNQSAYLTVSFNLLINLETRYDWLYFQYSIDGGTTWVNPVTNSLSTNGSGVNLNLYPPQTNYINNQSNRNGWTGNIVVNYLPFTVLNTGNNRFRFIFASDGSENTYSGNIYYADILNFYISCESYLPIELKEFTGVYNGDNYLSWTTATELNNDYFTLEHSIDGETWKTINTQSGSGTTNNEQSYSYIHRDYEPVINYYRLSQTDIDGKSETFSDRIVAIDNRNTRYIVKYINSIGQEVSQTTSGLIFIVYSDGTIVKKYN